MNDDGAVFFLGIITGAIAAFVLMVLFALGPLADEYKAVQTEAIKRGHAEWVVDQETGETTWTWKK